MIATTRALPRNRTVSTADSSAPCGLSAEECRTCSALPGHRRADWRASRQAAKSAAAAALGLPESRVTAAERAEGTGPRLMVLDGSGNPVPAPVSLSVSHRDGRGAAVAEDEGRRVGIDLERDADLPTDSARYFATPAEVAEAGSLPLTTLWSLKEAAWKALGCGDHTPFAALRLRFDAERRVRAVELDDRSIPATAEVSNPWPGYVLTVLTVGEDQG